MLVTEDAWEWLKEALCYEVAVGDKGLQVLDEQGVKLCGFGEDTWFVAEGGYKPGVVVMLRGCQGEVWSQFKRDSHKMWLFRRGLYYE